MTVPGWYPTLPHALLEAGGPAWGTVGALGGAERRGLLEVGWILANLSTLGGEAESLVHDQASGPGRSS